eukprot:SAG22_NODE_856_length_6839_cov_3.284570_10_plen_55_part_01
MPPPAPLQTLGVALLLPLLLQGDGSRPGSVLVAGSAAAGDSFASADASEEGRLER